MSEVIGQGDVDEAIRLMDMSKSSLETREDGRDLNDPSSVIYMMIRDLAIENDLPEVE